MRMVWALLIVVLAIQISLSVPALAQQKPEELAEQSSGTWLSVNDSGKYADSELQQGQSSAGQGYCVDVKSKHVRNLSHAEIPRSLRSKLDVRIGSTASFQRRPPYVRLAGNFRNAARPNLGCLQLPNPIQNLVLPLRSLGCP